MRGQLVLFSHKSDEYGTPRELFDRLNDKFHFTLDAAASNDNKLCDLWYSKESSALTANWDEDTSGIIWCNPPYSMCKEFVKKAYEEWKGGCKIVMLLPARTDTRWFHDYIYNYSCIRPSLTELNYLAHLYQEGYINHEIKIEFIKGRLKFSESKNSAPFPSMLVYFL